MPGQPEQQLEKKSGYRPKPDFENPQVRKGGRFTRSHAKDSRAHQNRRISEPRKLSPRKEEEEEAAAAENSTI